MLGTRIVYFSYACLNCTNPANKAQEALIGKERHVRHVRDAATQAIDQIDVMKKSILARAFRGELGTNDPADESAEELLKRIL